MKKIIFGAMAAVALLACSKDQVIEQNRANDEITFSIVAENQTKAAAVYCANNLLPEFDVCATYTKDGVTNWYFQNDHIKYQNSAWENTTTTRYWSADGTHNFYAIYNGKMNVSGIAEKPEAPTVNFEPSTTVAEQLDLLYAVTNGHQRKDDAVNLNFRHALSQIEFKAKNTNAQLYVKITGVTVGQTPGNGVFTYPTDATDANYEDHTQAGTLDGYTAGTWVVNTPADYTATFNVVEVAGGETKNLTISTDTDASGSTRNFSKSMLLLPTSSLGTTGTTAWTPEKGTKNVYNGTYLAVKCQIFNVAGNAYVDGRDVKLYDQWAYIPVSFTWEPGKKYIYTFVFGEGNGGYDDNGKPVLTPISYTVSVDDFQKGEYDVEKEMNI